MVETLRVAWQKLRGLAFPTMTFCSLPVLSPQPTQSCDFAKAEPLAGLLLRMCVYLALSLPRVLFLEFKLFTWTGGSLAWSLQ